MFKRAWLFWSPTCAARLFEEWCWTCNDYHIGRCNDTLVEKV